VVDRGGAGQVGSGRAGAGVTRGRPPPVGVELAQGGEPDSELADASRERLRAVLVVSTRVELVPWGSLARSEYKGRLVERGQ